MIIIDYQYVNQKLQIQLRFLMMSDITLETCWTINVLWNNKIPLLSCILLVIATSHMSIYFHQRPQLKSHACTYKITHIQQNSINPTRTEPERCRIIKYPGLSGSISILAGNYLFLLLHMGCTTNLKIIPFALSLSAGSGSSGSPSEFSESTWLKKLME